LLALGHRLEHELALPMGPVTPDTKKGRE
jgi:hypothetical protein